MALFNIGDMVTAVDRGYAHYTNGDMYEVGGRLVVGRQYPVTNLHQMAGVQHYWLDNGYFYAETSLVKVVPSSEEEK